MGLLEWLFSKPSTQNEQEDISFKSLKSNKDRKKVSVLNLRIGDIVSYDGIDYIIRNRMIYDSHGFKWFEYHLVDTITEKKVWLCVEDDDELEISICEIVDDFDIEEPIPKTILYRNEKFYLDEHDSATVYIESETGQEKSTQVEYWDFYTKDDEKGFSIERWGSEYEFSISHFIEEYQLSILPGE